MSNDISLSQALGGLRIANPDDATSNPSRDVSAEPEDAYVAQLPSVARQDSYPEDSHSLATESVTASPPNTQADQPSQASSYPSNGHHAYRSSSRPPSVYTAAVAAERDQAANSYNILRNEASNSSAFDTPVRSDSRSNHGGYPGNIPTRESSHRERSYNRQPPVPAGNSPLPPRRSSKGMTGGYASIPGVPMVPEPRNLNPDLPVSNSSDEWKDKGAAVSVRREVDASGKTVMKSVKKGVRDFSFGRVLGEGSYSTVYLATDRQTLKEYAIKVLEKRHIIKEKKIKYVNIEKDTLNRLTEHPGIVRLYYTFQDENSLYYVLDLCSGGELLGILKKTGTFDEECSRFFGAQILDAIEYMHSRGVIHRDLKPENVLLDDQLHVKITDFGTARLLTDPRAPPKPAGQGQESGSKAREQDDNRAASFVGTAEYVSPELLTNKNACKASDLWAFGCIIYQLLAGRPPFKAGSEYLTFQKIVNLEYDFPPGFPPAARDLVERCLVLDPARRLAIEHIKNHEFFAGQQFGKALWRMKAPRLRPYVPPAQEPKIIQLNGMSGNSQPTSSSRPSTTGNALNGGPRTPGRIVTDIPPPSQLDIEWSPVLTKTNERILKLGDLMVLSSPIPNSPHNKGDEGHRKFARFFGGSTTKKRQRLVMVTSSGRIVLAPAGGEEKKAKQEISLLAPDCAWRTQIDAKGQTVWCVDSVRPLSPFAPYHSLLTVSQAGVHYTFEDTKGSSSFDTSRPSADDWVECLEQAKELAINHSGSYHSDNGFGDMSSTMSSPASTFAGTGNYPTADYGISDRSHRNHLSKSQASLDDISTTKRHRFSKRQSKQGLGSAF